MKKLTSQLLIAILLMASVLILGASCKKETQAVPSKSITLTTDSMTQGQLTLIFKNEDTVYQQKGDSSRKALEKTFFIVYPEIMAYFNPDAPKKATVVIDPTYDGIAVTSNNTIRINPSWALQNPHEVDVITHEATHVVQQYNSAGYTPVWLVEGIADYSRNKFGVNNAAVGWYIPDYAVGDKYTDGYSTVARFLLWAEAKYKPGIAQTMDKQLRAGTYSDTDSWTALTGSTFGQLWSAYVLDPYY